MALWYVVSSEVPTADEKSTVAVSSKKREPFKTLASTGRAAFDILEKQDVYELWADAPGFSTSEIGVELNDKVLTISGRHELVQHDTKSKDVGADGADDKHGKEAAKQMQHRVWLHERHLPHFSRSFQMPDNAQADGIVASLDNGVLVVRVPKMPEPERPQPRRIAVQTAAAGAA